MKKRKQIKIPWLSIMFVVYNEEGRDSNKRNIKYVFKYQNTYDPKFQVQHKNLA